ncbi:7433_t:CDS:2 [Acaulospora colombiana]|uniref:7433_t:CDS:1 n=1 Tax=Acaulospora colombiana TaxID=27376 RepID=A0ACA9K2X6_9GLOM|nr:7433_t:CDS:2 [Acaulospora colombiana]
MLDLIQELTLEVNNDYFRQLKVLEDDIHLLIAEQKRSSVLDIFYLMMSYVLADSKENLTSAKDNVENFLTFVTMSVCSCCDLNSTTNNTHPYITSYNNME